MYLRNKRARCKELQCEEYTPFPEGSSRHCMVTRSFAKAKEHYESEEEFLKRQQWWDECRVGCWSGFISKDCELSRIWIVKSSVSNTFPPLLNQGVPSELKYIKGDKFWDFFHQKLDAMIDHATLLCVENNFRPIPGSEYYPTALIEVVDVPLQWWFPGRERRTKTLFHTPQDWLKFLEEFNVQPK